MLKNDYRCRINNKIRVKNNVHSVRLVFYVYVGTIKIEVK
jgi:hypothetical protein